MGTLAKKALMGGLGLALVLGWWTLEGKIKGGDRSGVSERIPAKVWEGGGTRLTIEVECSDPAVLRAYFAATSRNAGTPVRSLDTYEKVAAGSHAWTIDVPSAVGGDLEFQADNPKPGSRLRWRVLAGDKVLAQKTETLNQPLQGNEAFFLKAGADDFSNAEPEE